jgi:hypothetical protein
MIGRWQNRCDDARGQRRRKLNSYVFVRIRFGNENCLPANVIRDD